MFRVSVRDEFTEASSVNDVHWTKIFDNYVQYQTRDCFCALISQRQRLFLERTSVASLRLSCYAPDTLRFLLDAASADDTPYSWFSIILHCWFGTCSDAAVYVRLIFAFITDSLAVC